MGRCGLSVALHDGMSQPKLVLNLKEASEAFGFSESQMYEQTRARSRCRQRVPLPFLRIGKRIYFRRESLERWVAQLEAEVR